MQYITATSSLCCSHPVPTPAGTWPPPGASLYEALLWGLVCGWFVFVFLSLILLIYICKSSQTLMRTLLFFFPLQAKNLARIQCRMQRRRWRPSETTCNDKQKNTPYSFQSFLFLILSLISFSSIPVPPRCLPPSVLHHIVPLLPPTPSPSTRGARP